jgi:predicted acylesterase/phospholipase RssA
MTAGEQKAECDLVMKGGITSGVVYPPAVLELAKKYRFRQVGGASAGAIAAATAAAAQCGEVAGAGGFSRLQEVSDWLAAGDNLRGLFQAPRDTRPLLRILFDLVGPAKSGAGVARFVLTLPRILLFRLPGTFLSGAAATLLAALFFGGLVYGSLPGLPEGGGWGPLPARVLALGALGFALAVLGGVGASLVRLCLLLTRAARGDSHLFGICPGTTPADGSPQKPGLTDWLDRQLEYLAGRCQAGGGLPAAPLTFDDLEQGGVRLALMTADLSQQRPYLFPLRQNVFLFREDEMRLLFPGRVVDWMVAHPYRPARTALPEGSRYHFLPEGKRLPVLVAVRVSLSFPLLFSAVPLYTLKPDYYRRQREGGDPAVGEGDVQRHVFSDGGIVSNFPIQLFDEWLPRRPTFGINLSELPADAFESSDPAPAAERIKKDFQVTAGETPVPADGAALPAAAEVAAGPPPQAAEDPALLAAVYLPKANQPRPADWQPFDGLLGLLKAVFFTAKDYHDRMQALLPGYRDRVVTIRFSPDEGGLNLAMAPATVRRIQAKGRLAGATLVRDFEAGANRWVRFQVVLARLEEELCALREAYVRDADYATWLQGPDGQRGLPYRREVEWCRKARERLGKLLETLEGHWALALFDDDRVPKPEVVKRITPRD